MSVKGAIQPSLGDHNTAMCHLIALVESVGLMLLLPSSSNGVLSHRDSIFHLRGSQNTSHALYT